MKTKKLIGNCIMYNNQDYKNKRQIKPFYFLTEPVIGKGPLQSALLTCVNCDLNNCSPLPSQVLQYNLELINILTLTRNNFTSTESFTRVKHNILVSFVNYGLL